MEKKKESFKQRIQAKILKVMYFIGRRFIDPFTPFNRVQATLLMLASPRPDTVDAVAFFGRTIPDANADIFGLAANLYKAGANCIIINGLESERLGLSAAVWEKRLRESGVDNVQRFKPANNTASEAVSIIQMAKEKGWTKITLLAHAHQILRCMRAIIAAMKKLDYTIDVYTAAPVTNWFEVTPGSQNLNPMPRINHARPEYGFIVDIISFFRVVPLRLVSPKKVIRYIKWRDTRS